jgi:signal transduction histidine kinase
MFLQQNKKNSRRVFVFAIALSIAIFAFDLLTLSTRGSTWTLYTLPLITVSWMSGRFYPFWLAFLCTVFTLIGVYLSPEGVSWSHVLLNRFVGITAGWVFVTVIVQRNRAYQRLEEEKRNLEQETKRSAAEKAERTKAEAALRSEAGERKKVEERLRHAQKMEAIGQLAGGVAHDFNNMLTVIMGFGHLIRMNMPDGDSSKGYVNQIITCSEKAANLTQSLLAFSRRQRISLKAHNLNDLISDTGKMLQRLLAEDVEMMMELAGHNINVMADATQMDQVIMNLTTNARDAMPEGGVLTISTAIETLDDDFIHAHGFGKTGRYAVFSVSDTGVGMNEETQKRIFDPFFTTKEVGKGTGLGLSSVYGIVKQHNGYITVSSKPDRGTTFRVYLPLFEEVCAGNVLREERVKGGTETILIAEDDPEVRRLITYIFRPYGYVTLEATDGEEAVALFKKNKDRISLSLIDMVMPKKNGSEVFKEIRQVHPDAKVMFLSGYAPPSMAEIGSGDGKTDFMAKPVMPERLLAKVRQVLDR